MWRAEDPIPDLDTLNRDYVAGCLPGYLGVRFSSLAAGRAVAELTVRDEVVAHNGYLHAGTVVALADTAAGFGCHATLPEGAAGFTTMELKSNFLGTALSGVIEATAEATHAGRTTQVWDATVRAVETGRTIALFRCTQMILYPKS